MKYRAALALIAALATAGALFPSNRVQADPAATEAAPAPGPQSAEGAVARGRYLAAAGGCANCHTRAEGTPFAGGRALATPLGTIYSTNITPDDETGIGRWSAADLRRAMHTGIARDGTPLFPAFPYPSFTRVSDADVDDIYAYLHSLSPQRYRPPGNGILFSVRWPLRLWNALFFEPGRFVPRAAESSEWNRGAYLVEGLGHCGACHTPRNLALAEIPRAALSGGGLEDTVGPAKLRHWAGVNLTGSPSGLSTWSVDDLARYLGSGFAPRAGTFGPMNEVISNSLKSLDASDVHAMAVYLKSLPAIEPAAAPTAVDRDTSGERIYKERCAKCHRDSGRGGLLSGPPLAGSAVVQAADPASLINVILYGAVPPRGVALGAWESMRPYAELLDDASVTALCNYLRSSWGNAAAAVHPGDVQRQR